MSSLEEIVDKKLDRLDRKIKKLVRTRMSKDDQVELYKLMGEQSAYTKIKLIINKKL